ncbi:hypothetical protein ACFE04_014200 [Oxalis oulophora]
MDETRSLSILGLRNSVESNLTDLKRRSGFGSRSQSSPGKGRSLEGIKFGFSLVKEKANHPMEYCHVAKFMQIQEHELGLFAIYDGHLGDSVPAYLQKHLFSNILKEEEFWVDPHRSISKAYERTDQAILSNSDDLGRDVIARVETPKLIIFKQLDCLEDVYNGMPQVGFEKPNKEYSFKTEQTHFSLYMTAIASISSLVQKPIVDVEFFILRDKIYSKQVRDKKIARILGKAPTIAATAYLRMAGRPPVLPSSNLSYSENFLYMLDSFGVDVYTALAGAVGALYGPLHGGANEAVLKMLGEIGTVENIPEFIEGVKNRKCKMSGFGHRVYKNYDPRAEVIRKLAEEVFSIVGIDPLNETNGTPLPMVAGFVAQLEAREASAIVVDMIKQNKMAG